MGAPLNPFPFEAVATFGSQSLTTCDDLAYMTEALGFLNDYLVNYGDRARGYGGAIGLEGAHGAGKTHILSWLAARTFGLQAAHASALYAKADSGSFFNLVSQLFLQISRSQLLPIFAKALINLAQQKVGSAKITESMKDRIKTEADLRLLYSEGNLDREEIENLLDAKLRQVGVPEKMCSALLLIRSPVVGEAAYQWFLGADQRELEQTEIGESIRGLGGDQGTLEINAINSLELIAALFELAEVPLVLLIDQLEILLPAASAIPNDSFSLLKKMIEQIARRRSFLFFAGTREVWGKMPRDVSPRMRRRTPLAVGRLTPREAGLLLSAYWQKAKRLSDDALSAIHEASDGNPREILRIAFHEFARTIGDFSAVSPESVYRSSVESGTLEDRRRLAFRLADPVLSEAGKVICDFAADGDVFLDRVIQDNVGLSVGIIIMTASDALRESQLARRIHNIKAQIGMRWPRMALIIVAVGYTSREIGSVLSTFGDMIQFHEETFASELRWHLAQSIHAEEQEPKTINKSDGVDKRLEKIEKRREKDLAEVGERFRSSVNAETAEDREQRSIDTRWGIVEQLAGLERELGDADFVGERNFVKRIMIAEESLPVKVPGLERLASAYLELVAGSAVAAESRKLRYVLIARMRRILLRQSAWESLFGNELRLASYMSLCVTVIAFLVIVGFFIPKANVSLSYLLQFLPQALPLGGLTFALVWIGAYGLNPGRSLLRRVNASVRRSVLAWQKQQQERDLSPP